jgi:hypothetical protein
VLWPIHNKFENYKTNISTFFCYFHDFQVQTANKILVTCFQASILLRLWFDPEDGGDMSLRNVGWLSTDYGIIHQKLENFITTLKSHKMESKIALKRQIGRQSKRWVWNQKRLEVYLREQQGEWGQRGSTITTSDWTDDSHWTPVIHSDTFETEHT